MNFHRHRSTLPTDKTRSKKGMSPLSGRQRAFKGRPNSQRWLLPSFVGPAGCQPSVQVRTLPSCLNSIIVKFGRKFYEPYSEKHRDFVQGDSLRTISDLAHASQACEGSYGSNFLHMDVGCTDRLAQHDLHITQQGLFFG
eukprot:1141164-Pelagomonas_calceolata.AAC.1